VHFIPRIPDRDDKCGLRCSFGGRPLDEKAIIVEFLKRKSVQQDLKFRDLAVPKAHMRQAKRLEGMWVVFDGDDLSCHQLVPIIEEAVGYEFELPTFQV
jgi:hypothetical protein